MLYEVITADVTAMAEGPDGRLFTADTRGRVLRWLIDRPALGYEVIWTGDKIVRVMTLSPDASWLACGTEKSGIIMIPVDDDTIGYQMQDSCCEITSLIFAGDRITSYNVCYTKLLRSNGTDRFREKECPCC